jgi:hypothetical protein
MIAMEATIFTGWIYDHLLPHAEKVKVAHPLTTNRSGLGKAHPWKVSRLQCIFRYKSSATGSEPIRMSA